MTKIILKHDLFADWLFDFVWHDELDQTLMGEISLNTVIDFLLQLPPDEQKKVKHTLKGLGVGDNAIKYFRTIAVSIARSANYIF